MLWQASAGPVRAEELFQDLYKMGAVRASSNKFWEYQLAHGQRHVTNIHLEVRWRSADALPLALRRMHIDGTGLPAFVGVKRCGSHILLGTVCLPALRNDPAPG